MCGEENLCLAFPTLFNLAAHIDATPAEFWDHNMEEGGWNPIFLRSFNDCEMEEMERFLQILHRQKIRPFMEDKILLKGSKNRAFSVKIMYRVLDFSPQVAFPSHSIWNSVIPPRIGFFA